MAADSIINHYLANDSIHELFEAQVERTPQKIAVVCECEELTYRELNSQANRLAHHLRAKGIGPEILVGLCVERSLDMVVGMLAVLKAGAAYVPLDPAYPKERLAFMLHEARAAATLTQKRLVNHLPECAADVIPLDEEQGPIARENESNPFSNLSAENLAYVIFTSGSTGKPKGVQIAHSSVVSFLRSIRRALRFEQDDVWTAVHSYAFDFSVWEIWGCLLYGGRLVIVPGKVTRSPREFYELLRKEGVTVLNQTPSAIRQLLSLEIDPAALAANLELRLVICGGEPFPSELASALCAWDIPVWNFYGPTETTVWATIKQVRLADLSGRTVPIGWSLDETQAHILDDDLKPVSIGMLGEMHIGGSGLARGYLNCPDLTAEKFVPNPFSQEQAARLYKTGDLCRFLPDGSIEFVGRLDHQVKIRGFRIELEEIEATLKQHPSVSEAVAIAHEYAPDDRRLVAYVVLKQGPCPAIEELREYLKTKLPEFALPSVIGFLDSLPLTPNGKIDRRALPEPNWNRWELTRGFVGPRTAREELIAKIWAEVFKLEKVGIHDNFFDLGGHSLIATQIISRLRQAFHVELSMFRLFDRPTVEGLAGIIETLGSQREENPADTIKPVPRNRLLPLSFSQRRVWFLYQINPERLDYNFQAAARLSGNLNISALERSLGEIVRRHEIYRTTFQEINGEPAQVIHPEQPVKLKVVDLEGLPARERKIKAQQIMNVEFQIPFRLTELPLVEWKLMRFNETENILFHKEHHLVHDGWSFNVFIRELFELYSAYAAGRPSPLGDLPIQFGDFAYWQQDWMRSEAVETQLAYRKKKLNGGAFLLSLPYDRSRPAVQTFCGAAPRVEISSRLCKQLRIFSRQQGVTLFMTMLGVLVALLSRYSRQEDICVGSGIANRRCRESEGLIGMVVNNIVLRLNLSGQPSVREFLNRVRETTLEAYAHQDVPFDKVVEALQPKRHLSYNPIFQVMFNFHDAPMHAVAPPGWQVDLDLVLSNGSAKFDLNVIVIPHHEQHVGRGSVGDADGLTVIWEYNSDLFDATTIETMQAHYEKLLEGFVSNPESRVSELPLLTDLERNRLLLVGTDTKVKYPANQCIHQCVEEQVEKSPEAVAVMWENRQLTYRDLNSRANQLAQYLRHLGVGPEVRVGICMERSIDMVVGLMGILKAGGCYVPLDPRYPKERLAFMLDDSRAALLLTQSSLVGNLPEHRVREVCFDTERERIAGESEKNLANEVTEDHLAYIIYTSGSTGRPKGVAIEHRSVVSLLCWTREVFSAEDLAGILASTSICFDLSVFELFVPLSWGGKVVLVDTVLHLSNFTFANEVTLINTVPSAMTELLRAGGIPASVRTVNLAGETLAPALVTQIYRRGTVERVYDLYGPSESTTYSTFALREAGGPATIGGPISDTQVYLLDSDLSPVPTRVVGELCIGGQGLARGYWRCPDHTAEKFIPNPLSDKPGARLYRTGDLARYRSDGTIEFVGRNDHQVKLRGFRIEPGEIEAALSQHTAVKQAVVVAREDSPGEKRLVAYVIPDEEAVHLKGELRRYLEGKLPDFMLPSAFVLLEKLPLSPNGKLDHSALPKPDYTNPETEQMFAAPRTAAERRLAAIWSEVLGADRVGIHDDFFELGGHSLSATRIIARVRDAFQIEMPLRCMFENSTVAELAALIQESEDIYRSGQD